MASQRVLLLSVGGRFAETVWDCVCRWSNARTTTDLTEWSSDQWPTDTQREVDEFVDKIVSEAFVPPVLYRSEHVDCWSMGDVYQVALVKAHPDYCRQLYTTRHELIATRVRFTEHIEVDEGAASETVWLYSWVNECIAAWGEVAESRLIILVRTVLGGLWEDHDVINSLKTIPRWWTEAKQSQAQEVEPSATAVTVTDDDLILDLLDGRRLSVPLAWYPRLLNATAAERQNCSLLGDGYAIEWPDLDEHIGIEGLLAGRAGGESRHSLERWLAARREPLQSPAEHGEESLK
jgi:hypothetical protein